MTVFDELKARGLLAQLTDEEEIKELINNGKATFYIGFDPTADSLHVDVYKRQVVTSLIEHTRIYTEDAGKIDGTVQSTLVRADY